MVDYNTYSKGVREELEMMAMKEKESIKPKKKCPKFCRALKLHVALFLNKVSK
jgi:hypothetical protein